MNQKEIFLKSEGNAWYKRNSDKHPFNKPDVNLYKKYTENTSGKILEIGCANGAKLNFYREQMNGYGIDPSDSAILDGKNQFPDLHLSVGTADQLNFEDATFDIVVFGFCLYLLDRNLLLRSLSEGDRVLKNKGLLVITDFDSKIAIKRPYIHCHNVFSFKQQYENIITSLPFYTLVEKISYSHMDTFFHEDMNERVSTTVFYKNLESGYILSE